MYIWEKEIKSIKGEVVTFTDDTTVEYSEDYIKHLQSKEAVTIDKLYINKVSKIKSDIMKLFIDSSANKDEQSKALGEVWFDIARHEKNVMCDLFDRTHYNDIDFRQINKKAVLLDDTKFTN